MNAEPEPDLGPQHPGEDAALAERVEPEVVGVEAGDPPRRQEQHQQQDGQDDEDDAGPVRHALPAPLGRAAGRQVGGDPHEAAGYPGSVDEEASAPAVRGGIPMPGREGLAGGHGTGQDVVLGVGATRPRRVEHPAHRRARGEHGVGGAPVRGADEVRPRARRCDPSTPGRWPGPSPPPRTPSPAASRFSISRARSGTTSSASSVSRQRSSTERASRAACSSSPSRSDSAWAPAVGRRPQVVLGRLPVGARVARRRRRARRRRPGWRCAAGAGRAPRSARPPAPA